ncbi:MAG TPA: hypothetical protein P5186_11310 [Candidatus Paceibacterota bacterium]|nr:hypothetical protein [Candidatus Paceibacterota bacterium]
MTAPQRTQAGDGSPPNHQPPDTGHRLPVLLYFVFVLFALCLAAPWLWFSLGARLLPDQANDTQSRLWIEINTNLPGLVFVPESLDPKTVAILSTTNIINGSFYEGQAPANPPQNRINHQQNNGDHPTENGASAPVKKAVIQAMLATWEANAAKTLGSRMHTPDTCWLGSGWKEVPGLVSRTTPIEMGTNSVIVQSRVFEMQPGSPRVCVAWIFFINGRPQEEKWTQEGERRFGSLGYTFARGRMFLQNTLIALLHPSLEGNTVQFFRLFCQVDGDATAAREHIQRLAKQIFNCRASKVEL